MRKQSDQSVDDANTVTRDSHEATKMPNAKSPTVSKSIGITDALGMSNNILSFPRYMGCEKQQNIFLENSLRTARFADIFAVVTESKTKHQ